MIQKDIELFGSIFNDKKALEATYLITGITGVVGSALAHCILSITTESIIYAPVRNIEKAFKEFDNVEKQRIKFIECNLLQYDYADIHDIDYVIHCAAPTSSRYFVEHCVETFNTIIISTQKILDFALREKPKAIVYLSSLEVYGVVDAETPPLSEDSELSPMNLNSPRNSYPIAKRAVEHLCGLYFEEYQLPVKIARLSQVASPPIGYNDNRLYTQFIREAAKGNDITLLTTGESARECCYITDVINAILIILTKGEPGETYNIANNNCYITVKDLAYKVKSIVNPKININIKITSNFYPPTTNIKLSTKKIQSLGWKPIVGLDEMIGRIYRYGYSQGMPSESEIHS